LRYLRIAIRNGKQETGNRKQETGNRKQKTVPIAAEMAVKSSRNDPSPEQ